MKRMIVQIARCPKCGLRKELAVGFCSTCLEIIQVAEEKKQASKEWMVDLNKPIFINHRR